ncbi:MAG: radical SAM protein [Planctomycetia bacterium]|nr:radical SAM protein [Planctomycetia bacterium]
MTQNLPAHKTRCYRHRIEWGEEPHLIPCHLFYLSGCNLACRSCIAGEMARSTSHGELLTPEFFRQQHRWGIEQGARTIQWVGGEPGIHQDNLIQLMTEVPPQLPVVWKSNFYTHTPRWDDLNRLVTWFIADLKFGNNDCAQEECGRNDYWEVVTESLLAVYKIAPEKLMVRHLRRPGHDECCQDPVQRWCRAHLPKAHFSIGYGYTSPEVWPHNRPHPEPVSPNEETAITEILISRDGQLRIFGLSAEVREILNSFMPSPHDLYLPNHESPS